MITTATSVMPDKPVVKEEEYGVFDIVSPSRLNTWLTCRLKFRLKYIDKVEMPGNGAMHLGKCVHKALEVYNRARWLDQPADIALLTDTFSTSWAGQDNIEFKDSGEEQDLCMAGHGLLSLYYDIYPPEELVKPDAVEADIITELVDPYTGEILPLLHGVIDLVEKGYIEDYKTTGKSMGHDMVMLTNEHQFTAYSILYRNATGRTESGLRVKSLIRTKQPKMVVTEMPPRGEFHIRRFIESVKEFAASEHSDNYPPCTGQHCSYCDFRRYCTNSR